jgi:probable phosphoglycerate mutase
MDVPLSAAGLEQARALGRWLARRGRPHAVFTSPYARASQTASEATAAAGLDVPVLVDERLRERDFGALDRLTARGISEQYPMEAAARQRIGKFYYRPPGGESWTDVALRVRSVLDSIGREYAGRDIVVVAHEVVILMFRYVLDRLSEADVLAVSHREPLRNCSITEYRYAATPPPGGMRLVGFNRPVAMTEESAPVTTERSAAHGIR